MAIKKKATLWIGTSNITLPGSKQTFPAEFADKSRLNYYASLFNSLEVNSSFYKVPRLLTFRKWAEDVPDAFRFSVKLWKEFTHSKELKNDLEQLPDFLAATAGLNNKKGCLLIQFPGNIGFEYFNQVERLLDAIQNDPNGKQWRKAIEFRNKSWYVAETMELLDEYKASLVIHDIPKSANSDVNKKAPFVYIRYHGPTGNYRDSYDHIFLKNEWKKINRWLSAGKDVYVYFNNTIGDAYENARYLEKLSKG